jgi:hypothetical protein
VGLPPRPLVRLRSTTLRMLISSSGVGLQAVSLPRWLENWPTRWAATYLVRAKEIRGQHAAEPPKRVGALSGYVVGLGLGIAYGLVRSGLGDVSNLRAGLVLGLAARAGSDVPAAALGVTAVPSSGTSTLGFRYRPAPRLQPGNGGGLRCFRWLVYSNGHTSFWE